MVVFEYVFTLGSVTLGLSWAFEICQIFFDFQGLKDNIPILITALVGGFAGAIVNEAFHRTSEIEKMSREEINSDSFKLKFHQVKIYMVIALVIFYFFMSLAYFISG